MGRLGWRHWSDWIRPPQVSLLWIDKLLNPGKRSRFEVYYRDEIQLLNLMINSLEHLMEQRSILRVAYYEALPRIYSRIGYVEPFRSALRWLEFLFLTSFREHGMALNPLRIMGGIEDRRLTWSKLAMVRDLSPRQPAPGAHQVHVLSELRATFSDCYSSPILRPSGLHRPLPDP